MSGLIISDAVQHGITDTKKSRKKNISKRYKELVREANELIRQADIEYGQAIEKSRTCRAI